jgi:cytochrome d ubiquinol oxidase subunit II
MYHGLTDWWAPILLGWTVLSGITAFLALWFRMFNLARTAAVAQVVLVLVGWGLAQFPHLVAPDVTIQNAAAPQSTLKLLLIALGVGAVVLLHPFFTCFRFSNVRNNGDSSGKPICVHLRLEYSFCL